MRRCVWLAAGMLAAALLIGGCADTEEKESEAVLTESAKEQTDSEKEQADSVEPQTDSAAVQADSEAVSAEETQELAGESRTEGDEAAESSESAGSAIAPASTRQEALDLHDKAFAEHDFRYLLASCIEPYGQEYVDFLLANGLLSEEEYWSSYANSQGMYYEIGVFEGYSSEIISEEQIEDPKAIEDELLETYGYSCSIQDAYEVTYNQTAFGTEGTAVNEGYCVQIVQVDGSWYISKME